MTEPKWTPGIWRITNMGADKHGFYRHQIGTHEQTVAYTFEPGLQRTEQHANAHLLAAAPDMAEALEQAIRIFDDMIKVGVIGPKEDYMSYFVGEDMEALQPIRAALAKARGET